MSQFNYTSHASTVLCAVNQKRCTIMLIDSLYLGLYDMGNMFQKFSLN